MLVKPITKFLTLTLLYRRLYMTISRGREGPLPKGGPGIAVLSPKNPHVRASFTETAFPRGTAQ